MLCPSKLLHEVDIYMEKKIYFSLESLQRRVLPTWNIIFCQVAHHRLGGLKDVCSLQPALHPCLFLGKAVPGLASTLCLQKGAAASSYMFSFPSSTGTCTICATLTCNGRVPKQTATHSIFISARHMGFAVQR